MDIKVKYFTDIEPLREIEGGDWIDLRTARDTGLQAGQFCLIPLGIAMELPTGYEAHNLTFHTVDRLSGKDRGCFGSTGVT